MRPLRYSIKVTLDGCCDHRAILPDEELHRHAAENLLRAVEKFPADFMFQLTAEEAEELVSQAVIASRKSLGGALPYVFTEHGALQLSSVLRSARATQIGLFIVRAFVRLRQVLIHDLEMAKRLVELEAKIGKHDRVLKQLTDAAREFIRDQSKLKARVKRLEQPPDEPPLPNLRRIR